MKTMTQVILDPITEKFIDELKAQGGKPLYKLTPAEARAFLEKLQAKTPIKLPVKIEAKTIQTNQGKIALNIVRPEKSQNKLPAIIYIHGAGWVMGSFKTHERLMSDLALGANAAVIYVNYSLSPEARFPRSIDEIYAATQYIAENSKEFNIDPSHLAIAGDSVGGNMSIALTRLCKERHGAKISNLVLMYPVTSSELNTHSYDLFADGPWLTKPAMEWFWNAYEPDTSARKNVLMSPLNATIDSLKGFPPTLLITAENDVLRDEGEEFAHKLMQAGNRVKAARFLGTFHDFMMLNALAKTPPTQGALALVNAYLHHELYK